MNDNINLLFNQTIEKMKSMIDVSIVMGKLMVFDEIKILPISKVKCGFISGGVNQKKDEINDNPFGGAAGGSMTLTPVAFLVINNNDIKLLHLDEKSHILENLIELIPEFGKQVLNLIKKQ